MFFRCCCFPRYFHCIFCTHLLQVFHASHGILLFFHENTYMIISLCEKWIFCRGVDCFHFLAPVCIIMKCQCLFLKAKIAKMHQMWLDLMGRKLTVASQSFAVYWPKRMKVINTSAKWSIFEAWNTPDIILKQQNISSGAFGSRVIFYCFRTISVI